MKLKILSIAFLLHGFLWVSCGPSNEDKNKQDSYPEGLNNKQQKLFDEMMEIHDEAMPKQEVIYDLQGKVADTLKKLKSQKNSDTAKIKKIQSLADELAAAEEAMMQWMRSNDFKFDSMAPAEITTYLEQEIKNIKQIRKKMFTSIDSTKKILKME